MRAASLAARLRGLEVRAERLAGGRSAGAALSAARGAGLEFDDVREYAAGDDVRAIDWNVTARLNAPHVKQFREERDRRLHVVLDASASMGFAGKLAAAAEIGGTLALLAAAAGGRVGAVVCGGPRLPARAGRRHALRAASLLLEAEAKGPDAGLSESLRRLARGERSLILLLSDAYAEPGRAALAAAARRQEVVAVLLSAPAERRLPRAGLVRVRDPEGGAVRTIDCGSRRQRAEYEAAAAARRERAVRRYAGAGARVVEADAAADPMVALRRLTRRRGAGR